MAVVASLETLLCVEATDKLDPTKGMPTNEITARNWKWLWVDCWSSHYASHCAVFSEYSVAEEPRLQQPYTVASSYLSFNSSVLNIIPLAALAAILLVVVISFSTKHDSRHVEEEEVNLFHLPSL